MPSHECPRKGCYVRVPESLFACRRDWFALRWETQQAIHATADSNILTRERRAALSMARQDWDRG